MECESPSKHNGGTGVHHRAWRGFVLCVGLFSLVLASDAFIPGVAVFGGVYDSV